MLQLDRACARTGVLTTLLFFEDPCCMGLLRLIHLVASSELRHNLSPNFFIPYVSQALLLCNRTWNIFQLNTREIGEGGKFRKKFSDVFSTTISLATSLLTFPLQRFKKRKITFALHRSIPFFCKDAGSFRLLDLLAFQVRKMQYSTVFSGGKGGGFGF